MLKAIDVQQVVTQVEQTGKGQQVREQRPDLQQKYIELQLKEEKKLQQENVAHAQEAGRAMIRDEKEGEKGKKEGDGMVRQTHQESARRTTAAEENQDEPLPGGHINIRV